ncbi:N-acetyltransferase [Oceanobacillus bengalensis]|uniref:N-acetyltransferase n=1 Tax=Oceanobacillus bengalensis TaxID=1435466 RepID=UPI0011C427D2|nr:N-acetyltransferase [Oceanobacillus bengalensis]
MRFEPIDIEKHRTEVIRFRKDSFRVSFGDTSNLGDEEAYLIWLREMTSKFPEGFVLVEIEGEYIGQIELTIREYDGKIIVIYCFLFGMTKVNL